MSCWKSGFLKVFSLVVGWGLGGSFWAIGSENSVGGRSRGLASITSTVRDEGAALFGNPALLVGGYEAHFFVDASQGGVALTSRWGSYGSWSVGALDLSRDDRFLLEKSWNPLGTFQNSRNRVSAAYAVALDSRVAVGVVADAWRTPKNRWKPGATFGLLARPSSSLDVGAWASWLPSGEVTSRGGVAVRPSRSLRFHLEGGEGEIAVGGEVSFRSWTFRGGVRFPQGARNAALSGGMSWRAPTGFQLHYAYESAFPQGIHTVSFEMPLWKRTTRRRMHSSASIFSLPSVSTVSPGVVEPSVSPPREEFSSPMTSPSRRIVRSAVDPHVDIPSDVQTVRQLVEHHAEKYGIEIPLILAKIHVESSFNPDAVSPSGAVGLFQLQPPAARDMGLFLRDEDLLHPDRDPRFDPLLNADAGIRYLAHLLNRFGWNYALAVAAYNAGPSLIQTDIPSRRETERHVSKVMNYYYQYRNDPNARETALSRLSTMRSLRRPEEGLSGRF